MKIVISQPQIIFGGRIKVLLGITETLNEQGIEPVWLSRQLPGDLAQIQQRYHTQASFEFQPLTVGRSFRGEKARVQFNRLVTEWCQQNRVDWIIDSSNTVQGFDQFANVISYVHFPREARASSALSDIHDPNSTCSLFRLDFWRKQYNRSIFRGGQVNSSHRVICNSKFSLSHWQEYYRSLKLTHDPIVIYPFADDPETLSGDATDTSPAVASLGRFCRAKRQHEQIAIGMKIPELQFWLMGHANPEDAYFKELEPLAQPSDNVELLPNLSHSEVNQRLSQARYFLHTNINEPFGITAVEAILAGCIPVVHNSGGQREVVPMKELRFDQLTDVPQILNMLEQNPDRRQQWQSELQTLAMDQYVRSAFKRNFGEYFESVTAHST
ncbi:MAG: glycosyltransferase family 4 protein [Planctomycetota bacterium]